MNIYYKSSRVGLTPRSFFSHLPLMVIQNKYMLHHSTSLSSSTNIRITLYKFLLHFLYKSFHILLKHEYLHATIIHIYHIFTLNRIFIPFMFKFFLNSYLNCCTYLSSFERLFRFTHGFYIIFQKKNLHVSQKCTTLAAAKVFLLL